jgi:hypothetical protein
MYLEESKLFGATVVGAVTLGLGYNIGAASWGVLLAVALMLLYWLIFQQDEPLDGQPTAAREHGNGLQGGGPWPKAECPENASAPSIRAVDTEGSFPLPAPPCYISHAANAASQPAGSSLIR